MKLPHAFTERIKKQLGEEYSAFCDCFGEEGRQGLRVNTSKISVEEFLKITPFHLKPIPWTTNGFFYGNEDAPSKHPHYYAGLYYIQEPSAMVPAGRLPVWPGENVLDLCAAPGGKATELGVRLGGRGLLAANDVSATRAKALLKNLERFGIANCLVMGETPWQLLEKFGACFDKILVDAPCSGEGMFRKDMALAKSWEEKGPSDYAPLQCEILSCAASMLRPGGMLLYSTCTFSVEENEEVIAKTLSEHPDLELAAPDWYDGFSCGMLPADNPYFDEENREERIREINQKVIRIWPHRMEGEGHFAALLRRRRSGTYPGDSEERQSGPHPGDSEERQFRTNRENCESISQGIPKSGLKDLNLTNQGSTVRSKSAADFLNLLPSDFTRNGQIIQQGEMCLLLPEGWHIPKLRYLRTGLLLGTIKKDRFEPSQALAMALKKDQFPNVLELPSDQDEVLRYLKGETLNIPQGSCCKPGWVLVCTDGFPLGWGKQVNGMLRNKYQPGWRML